MGVKLTTVTTLPWVEVELIAEEEQLRAAWAMYLERLA
jgi:hypothetical protein